MLVSEFWKKNQNKNNRQLVQMHVDKTAFKGVARTQRYTSILDIKGQQLKRAAILLDRVPFQNGGHP